MQFLGNVGGNGFVRGMCKGIKNALIAKTQNFTLNDVAPTLPKNKDILKLTSDITSSYMRQLYNLPIKIMENEIPVVEILNILKNII